MNMRKKVWDFAYDIECEHNFKIDLSPILKNIDTFNYWLDTLPFFYIIMLIYYLLIIEHIMQYFML